MIWSAAYGLPVHLALTPREAHGSPQRPAFDQRVCLLARSMGEIRPKRNRKDPIYLGPYLQDVGHILRIGSERDFLDVIEKKAEGHGCSPNLGRGSLIAQ
jgi:hypothetical protein